jgi:juvenile hormone epoxide hydrolase
MTIPLLTTPRKGVNFVFEVIFSSLPGYGFFEGASKPGLGVAQMAVVMKNLMERTGFKKFYVQGGAWGGVIVSHMGTLFTPKVCKSIICMYHRNMWSSFTAREVKLYLITIHEKSSGDRTSMVIELLLYQIAT